MNKRIFGATALSLFALIPHAYANEPALQLDLGGYVRGYGVYTNQDEASGAKLRAFGFRKDSEIQLKGKVALDNGITAGAQIEMNADRADNGGNLLEESFLFLSSDWGQVSAGEDNGAGYLLQVAAPSADNNIDGVKPEIGSFTAANGGTRNYAMDETAYSNKLTYLTPVLNGFQAGASYAPSVVGTSTAGNIAISGADDVDGLAPAQRSDDAGELENAWDLAARYETSLNAIDVVLGAGYIHAALEADDLVLASDDLHAWNAGATIGWGAFGLGTVYLSTNNALENADTNIWVMGADYTSGAYKVGASYYNSQSAEGIAAAGTDEQTIHRWTAGVIYTWGPGLSLRSAVQYQEASNVGGINGADGQGTQVNLGTQIEF